MDPRDREHLLAELASEDDEVRRLAVERLSTLAVEEALPALIERLGDPSWRVRKAAVERLAAVPDPARAAASLVAALADGENPGRRNAALEALTRCGAAAVPVLVEASADADVDVRKQVVDALAGIADPRAAERLRAMLEDPDANVRAAAADALGAAGSERDAEALLRAATGDPEPLVRLSALRAMARLELPVAARDLGAPLADPLLRAAVYALLGGSDDPEAIDQLLKGVVEGSRANREAAMEALVRTVARAEPGTAERLAARIRERAGCDDGRVGDLLERLREAPLSRRLVLVQFLGLLGRPDTVAPLLEAGADEALTEVVLSALQGFGPEVETRVDAVFDQLSPEARRLAARALGRFSGAVGERRLRAALSDPDSELQAAAARSLGRRGAGDALPDLVAELASAAALEEDADPDVLAAFREALVAIAGASADAAEVERAMVALGERLDAGGASFRVAAARIMGEIGRPEDVPRIALLQSDPDERVRRVAAEALGRVAAGRAPEPLRMALADESAAVRMGAAQALAASGDPAVLEDLGRLSLDDDEAVRAAVMRAIGTWALGGGEASVARALPVLSSGLEEGGPVAIAALEALQGFGGAEAVRLARASLGAEDPELTLAAVACLCQHAGPELLEDLFPLVSHDHWSVRAQVVQVLAERGVERGVPVLLRRLEREQDDFVRDAILDALRRLER